MRITICTDNFCTDKMAIPCLGDSGYPLEPWLLTPYNEAAAEQEDFKRKYNKIFKKTRSVVERAIGNWKSRFRSMCK